MSGIQSWIYLTKQLRNESSGRAYCTLWIQDNWKVWHDITDSQNTLLREQWSSTFIFSWFASLISLWIFYFGKDSPRAPSVTQCAITRLFSLVSPSHITSPVSPSHLTSHITSHSSGIFLTTVRENIVRVLNKIWRRDILWMLRSAWSHRLQFHCWIWNADPWAGFSIRRSKELGPGVRAWTEAMLAKYLFHFNLLKAKYLMHRTKHDKRNSINYKYFWMRMFATPWRLRAPSKAQNEPIGIS